MENSAVPLCRKCCVVSFLLAVVAPIALAQSPDPGAVLRGIVTDPSNAPIAGAKVEVSSASNGISRQTVTGPDGGLIITGIAPDTYAVRVWAAGFQTHIQNLAIRRNVSVEVQVQLALAGQQSTVNVQAASPLQLDNAYAPVNAVDQNVMSKLPALSPASGLNDAITLTTGPIAADANGFFHPLGDHAQVSYIIDGQPISDQRNKIFSTSIPANAIESMDVISGSPDAEYGDKTSLVVSARTRSGLGQRPSASVITNYGSFGTVGEEATLGLGTAKWGNFLAVNALRTGRFLDTPEFWPMHDIGNTGTIFDRIDFQPTARDVFHLNLLAARNWFQVPNTYAQASQDQRQRVFSFNIAPAYQHALNAKALFTINAFFRKDQVNYYPSRDELDDLPAALSQNRSLTNYGVRTDYSRTQGRHNLKIGVNAMQTQLREQFSLAVTDPTFNAPCLDKRGLDPLPGFLDFDQCRSAGLPINPDFRSSLLQFDLTRRGTPFTFNGGATISQLAMFGQDAFTLGGLTISMGVRADYYNGLTRGNSIQPRGSFSYLIDRTHTVIRGGYSHTMETPVNENLVVSSSTGPGGLSSRLFQGTAQQVPIPLGSRNQYDAGIQQSLSNWVLVDVSYFRKYTRNAYDFDALFTTPLTFPIGWRQSKLDGISARISTASIRGFQAYATMGHANARFFGPEVGGIVFNSNLSTGAYRQDHDQVYQQTVNLRYQRGKDGWWSSFTWRYDSGLVVGAVNNLQDALALTADQQSVIGLYCGGVRASLTNRITACDSTIYGAERIHILAPGTQNADRNPPRTKGRHLFDIGVGTENLLHAERFRTILRVTVLNISNEAALYNFLSPFSGTHWVAPRAYQVQLGWSF